MTVAARLFPGRPSRRRGDGTAGSLPCMSRALTVSDTVVVGVEPDVVYAALSDVRQMGRWSPENTGAELADRADVCCRCGWRRGSTRSSPPWAARS